LRGAEKSKSGYVPGCRDQSAVLDVVENERVGTACCLWGEGECDLVYLLLTVGVQSLGGPVVHSAGGLPARRRAKLIGGHVAPPLDAATARVEALELFCGVG